MKKFLVVSITILTLLFITVSCDKKDNSSESNNNVKVTSSTDADNNEKPEVVEKKEEEKIIKKGDVIKTSSLEAKIKKIEFSYEVNPDDTSGFYTNYPADKGKVYVHVDMDIKNLQKQQLPCDKIMEVTVDYNGGYNYSGFAVVEDSSTGFTYANITSIDPLETKGIRFLVECPQEVAETKNPVSITFDVDGVKYKNIIR